MKLVHQQETEPLASHYGKVIQTSDLGKYLILCVQAEIVIFDYAIADWRMDHLQYLHKSSIRNLSVRTDKENTQKLILNSNPTCFQKQLYLILFGTMQLYRLIFQENLLQLVLSSVNYSILCNPLLLVLRWVRLQRQERLFISMVSSGITTGCINDFCSYDHFHVRGHQMTSFAIPGDSGALVLNSFWTLKQDG